MGMDLITAGWTTINTGITETGMARLEVAVSYRRVNEILDSIGDQDLVDNLEAIDYAGVLDVDLAAADNYEEQQERVRQNGTIIRDALKEGADTALNANMRMSNGWHIPDTTLTFNIAGGGSWGDDPFVGYSQLCMFLEATNLWPELAEASGIICPGLPDVKTMLEHQREA